MDSILRHQSVDTSLSSTMDAFYYLSNNTAQETSTPQDRDDPGGGGYTYCVIA